MGNWQGLSRARSAANSLYDLGQAFAISGLQRHHLLNKGVEFDDSEGPMSIFGS